MNVSDLTADVFGTDLVRIWHLDGSGVWRFFDPRPEFEPDNTLTILESGLIYWINIRGPHIVQLPNGGQVVPGWNLIAW